MSSLMVVSLYYNIFYNIILDSEPDENEKSTSDEQDNETPEIKLKNVPTPTKIRSETNLKTESTDVSIPIYNILLWFLFVI